MPAVFLDRLPLPSLQAYTAVSVVLLSCSVYYAVQITSDPEWKLNATLEFENNEGFKNQTIENRKELSFDELLLESKIFRRLLEIVIFMIQEPLCIWTLINMAYCCLILVGKFIQKLVFGELRVSEQQHIKDKFWNFVFYKFIFIFGVMNVQFMDEVVLWCGWFSVLGFLHLLSQLCKDRFEYLSLSPMTSRWTHFRLLALLSVILISSSSLFVLCVFVGLQAGLNTFAFMVAECALVTVRTLYIITRYFIHLWDINHEGVWEKRTSYVYYSELIFELTALIVDFIHHLHMLLWGNIFLSMASLVICMQLRYLFHEIRHRLKKHKNYLRVVRHMESNYPMTSPEEMENNSENCAICWDYMESARKLPCGHFFHNSCLRSWLEQDSSCPTCRMSLAVHGDGSGGTPTGDDNHNNLLGALGRQEGEPTHTGNQTTNHFFHFDGSRYVSWFPSFSVEVTHTNLLGNRQLPAVQTSQLDNMARQVQQMFPHMPMNLIMEDLRSTRAVELTIENILDERLVSHPSSMFQANTTHTAISTQDSSQENYTIQPTATSEIEPDQRESSASTSDWKFFEDTVFSLDEDTSESSGEDNGSLTHTLSSMGHGCRFSKSPQERETMLAHRKEELFKAAKRKYLATSGSHTAEFTSDPKFSISYSARPVYDDSSNSRGDDPWYSIAEHNAQEHVTER